MMILGGGAFGRWLGNEGGVLLKGWAPIRHTPEKTLSLPLCKHTTKRHPLWTRTWVLTRHQICQCLDLGLCTLQICAENFCCSAYGTVTCYLMMEISSEKCGVRWFRCYASAMQCIYTNLDGIADYIPLIWGKNLCSMFLYWVLQAVITQWCYICVFKQKR